MAYVTRRGWWKLALGVGLGIGSLVVYDQMTDERPVKKAKKHQKISFQDAKDSNDAEIRQRYLNQLSHLFERPYTDQVVYSQSQKMDDALAFVQHEGGDAGKRLAYTVEVFSLCFGETVKSEADLLSVIVDHEIDGHAKMLHFDSGIPERDFMTEDGDYSYAYKFYGEAHAYLRQMSTPRIKEISTIRHQKTAGLFIKNYALLMATSKSNLKDPSVIDRAAVSLFKPKLLQAYVAGEKTIVKYDGHLHWFADKKEGRVERVHMPEALCEKYGRR